jgi:hypothetical protein
LRALGHSAESEAALAELIRKYEKDSSSDIADVLAYRGEVDRAFEWLEKAQAYHDPGITALVVEPLLDNLRRDPRWLPLLRKIGYAPEQLAKIEFKVTCRMRMRRRQPAQQPRPEMRTAGTLCRRELNRKPALDARAQPPDSARSSAVKATRPTLVFDAEKGVSTMRHWTSLAVFLLIATPLGASHAADTNAQDQEACKQQEQEKGVGEKTSAVACAVKAIFQSRIRLKKDTEPVELTVGSPPMQTDDTDTPGPNNWEVNFVVDGDFAGEERRIEAPLLDVNYGIGDSLQLAYEVPYAFVREPQPTMSGPSGSLDVNGIGDSIFGAKYRFYDNKDTGLSFALYPQIEFRTPGANRSVSEDRTEVIIPILMTREFKLVSISANAGVELSSGERRYFAGFGVGKRLTENMTMMAEIVGTNLNVAEEKQMLLNVGLRRKISETQSISGSLGRDVYVGGSQREHTHFTLAYQKLFGK